VSDATPPIFRAPMRSRIVETCPGAGADHAIGRGVVRIGDAVNGRPASAAEAVLAVAQAHGEKAGRMLARFAALPDGTFVWTRQRDGTFRLGRISGAWRYDDFPAALEVGIHHVRPAVWSPRAFGDHDVPAAVAHAFARGGRNLQRMYDREAARQSIEYWGRRVLAGEVTGCGPGTYSTMDRGARQVAAAGRPGGTAAMSLRPARDQESNNRRKRCAIANSRSFAAPRTGFSLRSPSCATCFSSTSSPTTRWPRWRQFDAQNQTATVSRRPFTSPGSSHGSPGTL
jgi:hypothetical protein